MCFQMFRSRNVFLFVKSLHDLAKKKILYSQLNDKSNGSGPACRIRTYVPQTFRQENTILVALVSFRKLTVYVRCNPIMFLRI